MTDERTPGGSAILRHETQSSDESVAPGDEVAHARVSEAIEKLFGPVGPVFHEIVSSRVHIDVYTIEPNPLASHYTLFTTGMSDRPMSAPDPALGVQHAELVIRLPAHWKLSEEAFQDERNYWPIRWLKTLARLPHDYATWLGDGHTVPNGDPAKPFADNMKLAGWLVHPLFEMLADARLEISPSKAVGIYAAVPLYPEEMEFKLKHGAEALLDRFETEKIDAWIIDPKRRNASARKKFLGIF